MRAVTQYWISILNTRYYVCCLDQDDTFARCRRTGEFTGRLTAEYSLRQDARVYLFHQFESILDETRTRLRTVEFAKEVRP